MTLIRRLLRDQRGSNLVEFAIALPVLVLFIWVIFQLGLVFQALAGMQHALGEAARYATIYPTPTDAQLQAKVDARKFGTYNGTLDALNIVNDSSGPGGAIRYKDLTLTYRQPTDLIFFRGPTVNLTKTKRVYLAS